MGVNGLWQVLQPCARPTNLATLNRKRLAVDASIWIYQFLKAVRDKEGNALRNSHVVGFFRRICKLLWFGIHPVFVFDGGAPALKRATLQARRRRREGRRDDAVRTAGKLLAVQMQRIAEEEEEKRRKQRAAIGGGVGAEGVDDGGDGVAAGEVLPSADQMVYRDEAHMSAQQRLQSRKFFKRDAYHLPDLDPGGVAAMGRPEDPRIMSIDELEEYARQFSAGEDINLYDFSKIDFDGEFFKSLPPADRYNILNAARIRSRLRMGLSKEQLDTMFPDRMAFSRFQVERVRERNHLTQRLMVEAGMTGTDLTMSGAVGGGGGGGPGRVAGEKDREYILVKNEGAEGGWALGVVSRDKGRGEMHKPIDVDALQFRYQGDEEDGDKEDEDDEMEFEDVPIEGLNRLPKLRASLAGAGAEPLSGGEDNIDEDSLFVTNYEQMGAAAASGNAEQDDTAKRDGLSEDEDEDLSRAIAMSLQKQHGIDVSKNTTDEDDEIWEDVDLPAPQWTQKAAEAPRPIFGSTGQMVAHVVNNRSNAAVAASATSAKARETTNNEADDSSDSELDIRAAMARAARKKKAPAVQNAQQATPAPSRPIQPQVKNPFDGPLPFEKLDWRTSIFEKKPPAAKPAAGVSPFASSAKDNAAATAAAIAAANAAESAAFEVDSEEDNELAGGFEREPSDPRPDADSASEELEGGFDKDPALVDDSAPRPLPPWMADDTDIRAAVRQQQQYDDEINAEDREMALEEAKMWQRREEERIVEIDSSSEDGSDIELLDAPPPPKQKVPEQPQQGGDEGQQKTHEITMDVPLRDAQPNTVEESLPHADEAPEVDGQEQQDTVDKTNSAALAETRSSSPEMVFEDVEIPDQPQPAAAVVTEPEPVEAPVVVTIGDDDGISHQAANGDDGLAGDLADAVEIPDGDEFDISDPEDEELLAQMAEEAEEHARFASELNHNRTLQEGRLAYEQELKALRNQQKKDRRDADEVTQVMVSECQALLRLFGIPYITAPMEAEAQCAELVSLGLVDGIVTDDSDTFLFGGTRVYKNMFNGNKFVECYLAGDLEKELSLSRETLIALAQLLGSDYADGLPGVGPVTAMEILSEFSGGQEGLEEFRAWWHDVQSTHSADQLKELENGSAFRRKFRKSQATKLFLPTGFPSPAVADAYLKPEVDRSTEPFQWGVPDLDGLRSFLMATIGWSQERTDEVLVPVIRDMNRREAEGTQSNITRFFTGAVGAGARLTPAQVRQQQEKEQQKQQQQLAHIPEEFAPRHAPRNKNTASSRRMAAAVSRLKATTTAAEAAASVMRIGGAKTTTTTAGGARKRKGRAAASARVEETDGFDSDDYELSDGDADSDGADGVGEAGQATTKKRKNRASS